MTRVPSEDAFDQLYLETATQLVAYAYLLTGDRGRAQELTQEAFARAWVHWEKLLTYDSPTGWLYRVVRNLCVSHLRNRLQLVPLGDFDRTDDGVDATDRVALTTAFRKLPAPQSRALFLHDGLGLTVPEVAQEMGVPEGTIKSWISRSHVVLRTATGVSVPAESTKGG